MKRKESDREKYHTISQLIGEERYGDALNALNDWEEHHQSFPEGKILRIQLENILKYQNLDIYANTNLFMDPWLDE
jgi:hypothetical protein